MLLPLITALYQTEVCSPILTSPTTVADGAINKHFNSGFLPPNLTLRSDG